MGDPRRQLTHHGLGIGSRTDADVVAFDRADEGFSHSVALRTFDGRRTRFKTDAASEAARIASNVRSLDAMDKVRRPICAFIEVGWPASETAAHQPSEIKAAVWHSIIARAREIICFNHRFGGPNISQHSCARAYALVRAAVNSTN